MLNDQAWIDSIGARHLGERPIAARRRSSPPLGPPSAIEHIEFDFQQWDGPRLPWDQDFGKGRGQVLSLDGTEPKRSCNEVEVAKRLRLIRDRAFWFSEYNPSTIPSVWAPWVLSLSCEVPAWLVSLNAAIRRDIKAKRGGMPDVVAWNETEPLSSAIFIECKGPQEAFGEAQEDWVWAAQRAGVQLHQMAVSLRPF